MKKKRMLIVLLLAIVSGSVAAYSALTYLRDRPAPLMAANETTETSPVVVAARDLQLGQKLTSDDVRVVQWPSNLLPTGYATDPSEVLDRSIVSNVHTNEPILASRLADTGLHGMIPLIPSGMRALSVKVDEVVGVAGFVTPQTRVDVILIMRLPGSQEAVSKVILQNIQAVAANQQISEDEDGEPMVSTVVTVLVTPEQAERLALAATEGKIQMALRNTLDLEGVETTGERQSRLFVTESGGAPRPAASRRAPTSRAPSESIIEMYRGGVRTLISYR
ncbi:MAG: Flp pilus assembly protein CpaB [Longimicrobiales bacterium]|nr:Flp pilus assembly protein CpaB [Longimicrobiales bacterium]